MIIYKVNCFSSHSPSRSSSASLGYRPGSAPLDPPDREQNRETHEPWREDERDGVCSAAPHKTLVLLLDGRSTPQSVDAVYSHSKAEVWLWLPALQPQFLHHCPDHVAAALHTIDTLQQRREESMITEQISALNVSLEVTHIFNTNISYYQCFPI